jgi:hypothetical protein
MSDHKRAGAILREYFANVTHEQFLADVRKFCPEILEPELQDGESSAYEPIKPSQIPQSTIVEIPEKLNKSFTE